MSEKSGYAWCMEMARKNAIIRKLKAADTDNHKSFVIEGWSHTISKAELDEINKKLARDGYPPARIKQSY